MEFEEIVEALRALGCSHVQVVTWQHRQDCTEIVLKFLVKHEVLHKPQGLKVQGEPEPLSSMLIISTKQ